MTVMTENTEHKEYWFARDGDRWWLRYHFSPVHWKGFVALFGAVMGSIWLLVGGVLLIVLGGIESPTFLLKIICILTGIVLVALAIKLARYSFQTLRKRVDPVNTTGWYWKRFLNMKSEKEEMIEIKNLHVKIAETDTKILNGLDLTVKAGEVAAIMGPNGSGKSTLSYVMAGKDDYEITEGDILFNGESILEMEPDERAAAGLFLAFQYPVEIPGVPTMNFLKAAMNAQRKTRGEDEFTTPGIHQEGEGSGRQSRDLHGHAEAFAQHRFFGW